MSNTDSRNLTSKAKPMTEAYEKLSVSDYAKLRGLQPQLVHYYIRKGEIVTEKCACCGAKVIDVKVADKVMKVSKQ